MHLRMREVGCSGKVKLRGLNEPLILRCDPGLDPGKPRSTARNYRFANSFIARSTPDRVSGNMRSGPMISRISWTE